MDEKRDSCATGQTGTRRLLGMETRTCAVGSVFLSIDS